MRSPDPIFEQTDIGADSIAQRHFLIPQSAASHHDFDT
jgi:hypothetical protein